MLKVKFRFQAGHRDSSCHAPPWRLTGLFLNLTDACNLNCGYCHAYGGDSAALPLSTVRKVLDEAAAMGGVTILLTGGEPMLYPHLEEVLAGCRDRGLSCKIATNGASIGDREVALLKRYGVRSLQISLDTMDPDLYARVKGVSPAVHGDALAGIERCLAAGGLHLVVSAVAQRAVRAGLRDLMRYVHDRGLATFTVYRLVPFGRAAGRDIGQLPEPEFLDLLEELFEAFVALPRHQAVDVGVPWARDSGPLRRWAARADVKPVGCIAGKQSLTVLANGHAVPCVCQEDLRLSCGDLARVPLAEAWNAPVLRYFRGEAPIAGCDGCRAMDFCLGGCRAIAYAASGTLGAADPACTFWREGRERAALPASVN